jgi:hypothetical protein
LENARILINPVVLRRRIERRSAAAPRPFEAILAERIG